MRGAREGLYNRQTIRGRMKRDAVNEYKRRNRQRRAADRGR